MQEQTITALCAALTAQQLPFAQGEPLAPHTTFKIGGPAAFWCTPRDAEQLRRTLQLCRENGVRVYLLGNGSNTLFDDAGFDGAVIDMRGLSGMENSVLDTDAVRITAGAGQTLGRLCSKAQTLGLTGLEFACGIPGTVGGAVYMNAGAYGSELKDVLESVTFLDSDLQLRTLPAADLAMGYRTSIFEQNPDWCILSATVVLHRGDGAAVLARMQELLGKRREKQPLEWPSCRTSLPRPFRITRRGSLRTLLAVRAMPIAPSAAAKDSWPARKAKQWVSSCSSMAPRLPWPRPTLRCSATEPGMVKASRPSPMAAAQSAALFRPRLTAMAVPRV